MVIVVGYQKGFLDELTTLKLRDPTQRDGEIVLAICYIFIVIESKINISVISTFIFSLNHDIKTW